MNKNTQAEVKKPTFIPVIGEPVPVELTDTKKKETLTAICNEYLENPCDRTFTALMNRMKRGLHNYAFGILGNNEHAEEAVLVTFEKVFMKIQGPEGTPGKFREGKGQLSTWIYRICRNQCLQVATRGKDKDLVVDNDISDLYPKTVYADGMNTDAYDDGDPDLFLGEGTAAMRSVTMNEVWQEFYDTSVNEMRLLPNERMRNCMVEKYLNNLHVDEIKEKYGYKNVKNMLWAGRNELREIMQTKHKELYSKMYGDL